MSFWFWHGLRRGVQTTRYPDVIETGPGVTPGRPIATPFASEDEARDAAAQCPVNAITAVRREAIVNTGACVHCERCHFGALSPLRWEMDYEWARSHTGRAYDPFPASFRRSLHVMVVDAGDCGACLREVKQLNNPYYNMHRLGFFFTATPRSADVLIVVGPVTENMRRALVKTWEAMPDPKRVIAVGSCAITGGVFGRSFASCGGVGSVIPVDLDVPGNPPPPLAILHGLLVAVGRKQPASAEATERAFI